MRWLSADNARGHARRLSGLIAATCVFAALGAATPAHAATTLLITPFVQATNPQGVAADPTTGDVYVADAAGNEVAKVTPTGAVTVVASGLNNPTGVAVDPTTGDVYIADTGNNEVDRLADGALTVVAGTGTAGTPTAGPATASNLGGPSGLAVDGSGNLYIADGSGASGNPFVEKVSPDGTLSILAGNGTRAQPVAGAATSSPLRTPTGVAVNASGSVFIADAAANVVAKVTAAGTLSIFAGRASGSAGQPTTGTATSSRLHTPTGVATDDAGNLYIADTANNRIEEVTPADRLTVLAGNGSSGAPSYGGPALLSPLHAPTAVAASSDGRTYIANAGNATVDRVAPALPALSAAPTPSGTTSQGHTLTASPGAWANAPTSYSYGWERCDAAGAGCTTIAGASGSSYTLTGDDAGGTIRSLVTATNVTGATTVPSDPTAIILPQPPASTAAPQIAGTTTNLQTLAASPGSWTNHPTKFAYAWQDCDASGSACSAISGATASTYTLAYSDVGDTIRVVVTAINAGGNAMATSAPTAVVAPVLTPWAHTPPPGLLVPPAVSGIATVGGALACSTGNWSGSPTEYDYQWNRGNAPIDGATSATYGVTTADRGHRLSCTVTAVNAGGAIQADSARVTVPAPQKAAAHRKPRRAQHRRALTHRRRPTQRRRAKP